MVIGGRVVVGVVVVVVVVKSAGRPKILVTGGTVVWTVGVIEIAKNNFINFETI